MLWLILFAHKDALLAGTLDGGHPAATALWRRCQGMQDTSGGKYLQRKHVRRPRTARIDKQLSGKLTANDTLCARLMRVLDCLSGRTDRCAVTLFR